MSVFFLLRSPNTYKILISFPNKSNSPNSSYNQNGKSRMDRNDRGTMKETKGETQKTWKLLNEGKKRYEGIEVNHN